MSPLTSRQIFVWSLPTLFLLSFLWYKRKKGALRSDPGGTSSNQLNNSETSIEHSPDTSLEKALVAEVVEEKIQTSLSSSVKSENPISLESFSEEISGCLKSQLNPEARDFIVGDCEAAPESNQQPKILNCVETVTSGLPCDLERVDRLSHDEVVATSVEGNSSKENCASTNAEDCVSPASVEIAPAIVQAVQVADEEPAVVPVGGKITDPAVKVVGDVLNRSWSEVCELELSGGQAGAAVSPEAGEKSDSAMAREVGSDATPEGNAVEEDCIVRKLHIETTTLESKLSDLALDGADEKTAPSAEVAALKEKNGVERDSANHSPAEVMLGSPSMSNYSDAQSEGSSDSGKGCSDVATPPSRTPASGSSVAGDPPVPSVYEFVIPQLLVGRLIGMHGNFVHQIKTKTHANILIKRHPETPKLKICAIEGTQMDIEGALDMIRQKFPLKRYPNLTLEQVSFLSPAGTHPLMPESFQLQLVEGVNNDVILSSLVSPAHFFLQQPTHPTYPALNRLNLCMNYCYSEPTAPALPTPIESSVICVAPTMGGWYRAQVVASDPASDTSDVRFIDYGGYLTIENSLLRQIRSDFITLPFQAAECYLANVKPKDGVWAYEAMAAVEELTHGQVIQAQIYGYAKDGVPAVYLFSIIQGSQVVLINRELVERGYAEWDEPTEEAEPSVPPSEAYMPIVSETYAPVVSEAYTPHATEA